MNTTNHSHKKFKLGFDMAPIARLQQDLFILVESRLWLKVIIALFLGVMVGLIFGPSGGILDEKTSSIIGKWLSLPGNLFLATIKMVIIPLVSASIIRGLFSAESFSQLKDIGVKAAAVIVVSTMLAVSIGMSVTLFLKPGAYLKAAMPSVHKTVDLSNRTVNNPISLNSLPEKIVDLVPTNPLGSMVANEMLQVVIFSFIIGFAMLLMESQKAKPLLELLASVQEVAMTLIKWIMQFAPIAVFGLVADMALKVGYKSLIGMGFYVLTVLLALAILFFVYLVLIKFLIKKPLTAYMRDIKEVLLLAFSTSSSAAVMPLTMKTVEEKLGVRANISRLVVPLAATINMNGTGLYQGAATVFLAQIYSVNLSLNELVIVVISAVGASIGAPAAPGVGIAILSMILASVGIPTEGIVFIIGVDRILDMARTVLNVMGDIFTCSLLERFAK